MSKNRWSSVPLILSLVLLLFPAAASASTTATLSLVPSDTTPEVGDTVTVDVDLAGLDDLYAVQVHLAFDPATLQVLDDNPAESGVQILPGSLFPKSDPSYVVVNQVDNAAGTIDFAITLLAPESPLNGQGTLASIRFTARMEGTAEVEWTYVQLADSNGQIISHTADDQTIVISTPAPSTGKNCSEVLQNGGMEADAHWDMPVTPHKADYSTADWHSGARSIRLGIEPGDADVFSHSSAYQEVHIPANATSATLTFWAKRYTQETPKGGVDPTQNLYDPAAVINGTFDWTGKGGWGWEDWQEVLVLQADCYNWLATLMRARSNDGAWTQYTYDVSAFAGQDIVIYFNAINDGIGGQRTWMYVDDVQVQVCYDDSPCTELVDNRGFEWTADWEIPASPRPANYTTAAAHDGSRSMRLGIVPPTADTYSHSPVFQAIDVPAGAAHPTLTFWVKAHSEESPRSNWKDYDWSSYSPSKAIAGETRQKCCGEVDWQEALVLDENYQIVSGGVVLRQVQTDGQWRLVTYDLSPYKGMRLYLYFNVINDGNGQRTWMYVDDVSVNLCGYQVRFQPDTVQVATGATFNVDATIENIEEMYRFEATIRFDPAILEVIDADGVAPGVQVNPGAWLPAATQVLTNTVDNAGGAIWFAATLVSPEPALSGSGALISIPFHAKSVGSTPVTFAEIKVVDAAATSLPMSKYDGQVTVTGSQATIAGTVLLEGRTDHSGTLVQLSGGSSTTTAADGSYVLTAPAGTYTLIYSHASYLAKSLGVTGFAGTTTTVPQETLLGGDVNADQSIDILDLVSIAGQFGSASPTPSTVDINGDGEVDIIDIVLVAKNFQ